MPSTKHAAILLSVFALQACQTAELQHTAGTEGKSPNELAWIVTSSSTQVLAVDGEEISVGYSPLPRGGHIHDWLAVSPGKHELTLFYSTDNVSAAAPGKFMVDTAAGMTSYVYARSGGGIRYYRKVLNGPANEAMIAHINARLDDNKLPCATLSCTDESGPMQ